VERNSPPDRLEGLDLFLEWAAGKGLTDAGDATALRRASGDETESFLDLARELREALYRIFAALVAAQEPAAGDLAVLDRQLSEALPNLHLARRSGSFSWILPARPQHLGELLWPIVLSAVDLLRSDRFDRVKECRSDTCSWMFIDESRNRSRMFIDESRNRSRCWCDMADCGNRAKARRFYQRHSGSG
jgi:predicted RNA-binding Zn ribbon-like protein